jgi:nitroreductase
MLVDVYRTIRERVAVKGFTPDPVPERIIKKILRAGRWAPSQRNRQPWHFILVQDRDTLGRLASLTSSGPYIAEAPMAIAIVMENARMPQFDAGRLIENMLLAAWSEGIGTSFVGGFDHEKVKELLNIPDSMEFITAMPYGYPTEEAKSGGKRRKPLSETVHRERFGDLWSDI